MQTKGVCLKCCKVYLNVKRCTLHPESPIIPLGTIDEYRAFKKNLLERCKFRSNILVFIMFLVLLAIYLYIFSLLDGCYYISLFITRVYEGIASKSGIILILLLFVYPPLLPVTIYFLYIILFPVIYLLLLFPSFFIARVIYQAFSRLPFIPVIRNRIGDLCARLIKGTFVFMALSIYGFCWFFLDSWGEDESKIAEDFETIFSIGIVGLVVLFIGISRSFSIKRFIESITQAFRWLLGLDYQYEPRTDIGRIIMWFLYPVKLHHRFYQRYSALEAGAKIETFLEKMVGTL